MPVYKFSMESGLRNKDGHPDDGFVFLNIQDVDHEAEDVSPPGERDSSDYVEADPQAPVAAFK